MNIILSTFVADTYNVPGGLANVRVAAYFDQAGFAVTDLTQERSRLHEFLANRGLVVNSVYNLKDLAESTLLHLRVYFPNVREVRVTMESVGVIATDSDAS